MKFVKELSVVITIFNNSLIELQKIKQFVQRFSGIYEIIIVDDSSIHFLLDLEDLKNFCDINQTLFIRNKVNLGPSGARNVGISNASCPYIALLDGDDEWSLHKTDIQMQVLKMGFDLVGASHAVIFDQADNVKSNYEKYIAISRTENDFICREVSYCNFLFKNQFCTPSVIAKSEVLKKNIFDESMRYAEDFDLWLRISRSHKVCKIMLPLVFTFKHDFISSRQSLSSNLVKMELGELRALSNQLRGSINPFLYVVIFTALSFSVLKFIRRVLLTQILTKR